MKYAFIQTQRQTFRLTRLCQVLQVSRSGFYAWRKRPRSRRAQRHQLLGSQITQLHQRTREAYGAVKLWHALTAAGFACGKHQVARLRRMHGLEVKRVRRFRRQTEHHHLPPPASNLVEQQFAVDRRNHIWAGDITMLRTRAGGLYLAVIVDLYSRRIVGWAMSARADQALTAQALRMAVLHRQPKPGLIHHSDQGCQYAAAGYRELLAQHGLVASMSHKGNCYDNAVVESFFSTLKNELIHDADFRTREEAQSAIFAFIEMFYNRQRLHQTLGYVSPVQFETDNPVPS